LADPLDDVLQFRGLPEAATSSEASEVLDLLWDTQQDREADEKLPKISILRSASSSPISDM